MNADAITTPRLDVDFSPSDTDAAQALDIMRGAQREVKDPDIALAVVLTQLHEASSDEVRSTLASLISDASSV